MVIALASRSLLPKRRVRQLKHLRVQRVWPQLLTMTRSKLHAMNLPLRYLPLNFFTGAYPRGSVEREDPNALVRRGLSVMIAAKPGWLHPAIPVQKPNNPPNTFGNLWGNSKECPCADSLHRFFCFFFAAVALVALRGGVTASARGFFSALLDCPHLAPVFAGAAGCPALAPGAATAAFIWVAGGSAGIAAASFPVLCTCACGCSGGFPFPFLGAGAGGGGGGGGGSLMPASSRISFISCG